MILTTHEATVRIRDEVLPTVHRAEELLNGLFASVYEGTGVYLIGSDGDPRLNNPFTKALDSLRRMEERIKKLAKDYEILLPERLK